MLLMLQYVQYAVDKPQSVNSPTNEQCLKKYVLLLMTVRLVYF